MTSPDKARQQVAPPANANGARMRAPFLVLQFVPPECDGYTRAYSSGRYSSSSNGVTRVW